MPRLPALLLSLILFIALIGVAFWLNGAESYGRENAFAWIAGGVFGVALQRSRFCFFCNFRDTIERKEAGGTLGILLALAAGIIVYHVITGAWIAEPAAGFPPPKAHIAPIGWHLVLGGVVFGLGMAVSGSCISAHLYRIGEGSVVCVVALLGTIGGFTLGFASWNPIYLNLVAGNAAVWLPSKIGFGGALAVQFLILGLIAYVVWRRSPAKDEAAETTRSTRELFQAVAVKRWPGWVGGLIIGVLAGAVLLRTDPLGVTSELSRIARFIGNTLGVLPERLEGLDQIRGCASRPVTSLLSNGSFFAIALMGASFAAALLSGEFEWEWPNLRETTAALLGGVLLGWGAMVSLGCSVGTLLSGIHASAVSGWIFAGAMLMGLVSGLPVRRWVTRQRQVTVG